MSFSKQMVWLWVTLGVWSTGLAQIDVSLRLRTFGVAAYGAQADGSICTRAFAAAIDAAAKAGGGRVDVPKGTWVTGPIHLRSNVELHLEEGATLSFTDNPADYLPVVRSSWGGLECMNYSPLVYAFGCTNVAVTGAGTLAPQMGTWTKWAVKPRTAKHMAALCQLYQWADADLPVAERDMTKIDESNLRPQLMLFNQCGDVRVEGIRIRESPLWCVHFLQCENVRVKGLDIRARGFNNDGIDIECSRNVLVEDCHLDQGDDGFVIKSGRDRDGRRRGIPVENVEIRNCHLVNGLTLLGVGSEVSGGVRNIHLHDCTVDEVGRLFQIKTSRRKGAFVEGVAFDHVTCGKAKIGFEIATDIEYQYKDIPSRETNVVTRIENVSIADVQIGHCRDLVRFVGDPQLPPRNIRLANVTCPRVTGRRERIENVLIEDLDKLREQVRAREAQGSMPTVSGLRDGNKDGSIAALLARLRADGTWGGVDYETNERGYWPSAYGHLTPLRKLAEEVYRTKTAPDARVVEAFHRALDWWLAKDPMNSNWWWNEIGVPQTLGEACLLFTEPLTAEERAGVVRILKRADASKCRTGQNHVWLERVRLIRALIEDDPSEARKAVDAIAGEIFLSDSEGIRSDWCFHQHGRQPQFGNYGLSYAMNMTRLAAELQGTSYAFPSEKLQLLRNLLEHGLRWVCWKGHFDVSAMGRQLMPEAQVLKASAARLALTEYGKMDPSFPRDEPRGFRYFDKSAYAVYRTDRWMASIRMATRDIIGVETWINSENTKGGHLADGCLLVYATGREYEDVYPLWNDWRMLPGITSYKGLKPSQSHGVKKGGGANDSDFVRGYETKDAAVVEMELKREGLRALKSWRLTPTAICCEGREIAGTNPKHAVVTTVEQAHAASNVEIFPSANGFLKVLNGEIGYVIEADESICHRAVEDRTGDFRTFNLKQPSCPKAGKILSIWIDHGVQPKNASYRYWVLPATTRAELLAFDGRQPVPTRP